MLFLYVIKNSDGSFTIVRYINNPINVRGNSGITYCDISKLDLATRIAEGFWTQSDIYVDDGEYMVFDNKVVTFDETTAVVTNTYTYVRMDLNDIKTDIKTRVDTKRIELYYGTYTFETNNFNIQQDNRLNILTTQVAILTDPTSLPSDFVWKDVNGIAISMDSAKFKEFSLGLFNYSNQLFVKSWNIKNAIDAATTYEDIRTAATWDDTPL